MKIFSADLFCKIFKEQAHYSNVCNNILAVLTKEHFIPTN